MNEAEKNDSGERGGMSRAEIIVFRTLAVLTAALALHYLLWRYQRSLNPESFVFSLALVLAETYGVLNGFLFILMAWRPIRRSPPPPPEAAAVDVFITTYNEPVDLVMTTAEAAVRIDWPTKKVYILDDGDRREMREAAEKLGCGYISRGPEWAKKPRHAKAGNVNNALLATSGEFILLLDADQIPTPRILRRTLGYFDDPKTAFVQTPQVFYNLPPGDPFGNDAPLFYGPILEGKDSWNAAFFCGSNAVLRREALMMLGLTDYVLTAEKRMKTGLRKMKREIRCLEADEAMPRETIDLLRSSLEEAETQLKQGLPLESVSDNLRRVVNEVSRWSISTNLSEMADLLTEIAALGDPAAAETKEHLLSRRETILEGMKSSGTDSPVSEASLEDINLTRSEEAIPIQALSTNSVTEDMATALRLHALGWKSVFHKETLAYGLAPEDLGTSLKQRLRWAQGTLQVFFRENPLFLKGLTLGQRLMYFATMYSYFNGFFNLVLLTAPPLYLFFGIKPVLSWSNEFLWRLFPYFIMNKILFRFLARGVSVRRGEQYDLALFPLNIKAVFTVLFRSKIGFVVTEKKRQNPGGLLLIWPQAVVIAATAAAIVCGAYFHLTEGRLPLVGLLINIGWGLYNLYLLSVIVKAAWYKPPEDWKPEPPEGLLSDGGR